MKDKKISKMLFEYSLKDAIQAREELDKQMKDGVTIFVGIVLFLFGFFFNLTASIIYELIKDNMVLKIIVLVLTLISVIVVALYAHRYVIRPIKLQKDKLEELRLATHAALDRFINHNK